MNDESFSTILQLCNRQPRERIYFYNSRIILIIPIFIQICNCNHFIVDQKTVQTYHNVYDLEYFFLILLRQPLILMTYEEKVKITLLTIIFYLTFRLNVFFLIRLVCCFKNVNFSIFIFFPHTQLVKIRSSMYCISSCYYSLLNEFIQLLIMVSWSFGKDIQDAGHVVY